MTDPLISSFKGSPDPIGHAFGFGKSSRLLKSHEYEAVFQDGIKDVAKHFVMFAMSNGKMCRRMGLVVSKKVGNSVERNRIKRKLREQFRLHVGASPKEAMDYIVVARPGSKNATSIDVNQQLRESMFRLDRRTKKKTETKEPPAGNPKD
jgi:ribonuclease P protein component